MRRRAIGASLLATALAALGVVALAGRASKPRPPLPPASASAGPGPSASASSVVDDSEAAPDGAQCATRPLAQPAGSPASLSCASARRIVSQVREKLAAPAVTPNASLFGDAVVDWLDPHGLWSAAPDAPSHAQFKRLGGALIKELERPVSDARGCDAAAELGRATRVWVTELRKGMDAARARAQSEPIDRAFVLASEGVFQDDPVTRPARELARDLGQRIGTFERVWGAAAHAAQASSSRLLPDLSDEGWAGVVLAAALRAYVPAIDPHGQWAPLDEEWSLYASDPALDAEPRLWGRMERTALGVRVTEEPTAPLTEGDLVLSVGGNATAGLSVEQLEQLSHLEALAGETTREVVVLRKGEREPRALGVPLTQAGEPGETSLGNHDVPYADANVLVIAVPDVPDDLGDDLEQIVAHLADAPRPPIGILLDLRGNGGGSIDGAAGAIGVFLPGAPSFPLRRRDGEIEIEHAGAPSQAGRWQGPVAALVDGYTASAAEMIAGAIATYRRGPVVGSRTFGKGCVQEYFDDRVGSGVLKLTTMLFSLPDGSPLQGVGLTPSLALALPSGAERERMIPGAMSPWRGPDVRNKSAMGGPEWPTHSGHVGPCDDPGICAALRRLGSLATARRGGAARLPRRTGP